MNKLLQYKRNGFTFNQVDRIGNIAYFIGVGKEGETTHEVIEVQSHNGREIGGIDYPPAEYPPSNEQWGRKGWTYSTPLQARIAFDQLTKPVDASNPES